VRNVLRIIYRLATAFMSAMISADHPVYAYVMYITQYYLSYIRAAKRLFYTVYYVICPQ
jgi:hypothetical protein